MASSRSRFVAAITRTSTRIVWEPPTCSISPSWRTRSSLEHVLKPISLLIRDESTGELEHREVVGREALPAHEQPPKAVVPTVGSFDDPASWRPRTQPRRGG